MRTVDFAEINRLTEKTIGAAIEVHRTLGPGLLESTYEACLEYEALQLGYIIERQKALPLVYKGMKIDQGYRIDLLINQILIVEVKAVETVLPIHEAQILSYLKHSGCKAGLLFNFNVKLLKLGGIHRFIMD